MPSIFIYLCKLSVALAVVYLFYHFVLRRLTFYNWNRWYLVGYSALCFIIPFIDISRTIDAEEISSNAMLQWVPNLKLTGQTGEEPGTLTVWTVVAFMFASGVAIMGIRLVVQLLSFRRLMRKATLLSEGNVRIYQVNEKIIPFSFGKAVFINPDLHSANELEEIIRHEFVHVKQRHSFDILFSEILCLFNWYNPFAWLLRAAIRQNLEFVADNKVLENGLDKKQYQYLLLKVIGNNQFSIAQKFNFSSLKKRIAMMNKNKSARLNLLRFLFVLPVLTLILVSFRKEIGDSMKQQPSLRYYDDIVKRDSVPAVTTPNSKGYIINVVDKKGNCELVIKDRSGKEVKRMMLDEWNLDEEKFESMYGEILSPPTPPAPPTPPVKFIVRTDMGFPVTPAVGTQPAWVAQCREFEITSKKAIIVLKDGTTEKYDLTDPTERKAFEKKYGNIEMPDAVAPAAPVEPGVSTSPVPVSETPVAEVAPGMAVPPVKADRLSHVITGDELITITINKSTTKSELEGFRKSMKEKGVELKFDEMIFKDGKLITITGTMKSGESKSNFVATDFEQVILAMIRDGERTWFKVNVLNAGEVVI